MDPQLDGRNALLLSARGAHSRRDWLTSYESYKRASEAAPLATDDLDALASAAWHLGICKESVRYSEQVFKQLCRSDPESAAAKAVDIALAWLTRGDLNIGQGWMSRARRLLQGAPESHATGYLAYLDAYIATCAGDTDALTRQARTLREMSGRLDSPAVTSLCLVVEALVAISEARMADAFGLIDEAMLAVLADVFPIEWAGDIYCLVLHHCNRLADLPRMRAWTQSMERWCENVAALPYGGVCEMHRLQLLSATEELRLVEDQLSAVSRKLKDVNTFAAAEGYYELGEIRRMRGDIDGAVTAFSQARSLGVDPQPGEALLKCRQGDSAAAWTALQASLAWQDRVGRMRLLRAAVEVALERDRLDEAEKCCGELEDGAQTFGTPGFKAWAAHARGMVLVRRGQYVQALDALQAALREYRTQQCRYETAEVYEYLAATHKALGDNGVAAADTATAQSIYKQLGVQVSEVPRESAQGGLTKREMEILARIANGATNKQVAEQIFISQKTVGRHLANIYAKLGVSSRTAAATWAHANGLLGKED
ncbi:helix-turn-helix transcriptional regulator [Mycolicibacterium agri]|uniref:Helix-turn-helix transcriptional regulator n=1 Tax=Mycolicibacterium agri TaxID=36811 RepID=A0A2A7MZU2_MYCAG|nr:helix-turn-helix transcriptional regulator [Mycolicibacterium agri]PEG36811.1 helix-turn-helix transcriptional regulator [Mycolicibacterium agri]GFG50704.1 helix-turn-helix transcriptional regulator [Mycolicibacterium agri]